MANRSVGNQEKRKGFDFLVDTEDLEGPSKRSVQDEQAKLAEAMRAAQEALRATEQEDVEFTEDDMNDPALMAEMERLEKGDSAEPPAKHGSNAMEISEPTSIQSQARTVAKGVVSEPEIIAPEVDEYTARLIALVNRRIREYYNAALAAKEAGIAPPRSLVSQYTTLKEMKQCLETGGVVDEEDIPGPPEALESVPARAQPTAKTTPAKASAASRPSPTGSPQQNLDSTRRTGVASPTSPTGTSGSSNSVATTNTAPIAALTPQQTFVPPVALTPAELREKKFQQLLTMLLAQAEELKKQALEASAANKKTEAMTVITKRKALVRDIELLKLAHSTPGTPPPTFHIDTIEHATEVVNADVSTHEVEISITHLEDVKPPSLQETVLDLYVICEFPYPDPNKPTILTTSIVKGTLSPAFNFVQKLRIDRNKALLRAFSKKKVIFQVWKPKSWFLGSAKLIGRCEMKIAQLTDVSEVHETMDILDETGHKVTGGKMHAAVRLRTPLLKKQVTITKEKILVIDKHHIGETVHDPTHSQLGQSHAHAHSSQQDLTQSTVASITSVTPATQVSEPNLSESRISPADLQMSVAPGSTSPNAMPSQEPTETDTSSTTSPAGNLIDLDDTSHTASTEPASEDYSVAMVPHQQQQQHHPPMEVTHPSSTTKPEATSSSEDSSSAPAQAAENKPAEPEEFDFNSARWITSHSVLQWRKDTLDAQIAALKAKKAPEEEIDVLEAKKGDIEHKMTILIVLVQSGQLSEDEYIRRIKLKLTEEEELFQRLKSVNRSTDAADCKERIRIMKEEIGM